MIDKRKKMVEPLDAVPPFFLEDQCFLRALVFM